MTEYVPNHEKLEIWKDSIILVTNIYKLTKEFPSEERYGLTDQIRRAMISVPANIAEGSGRGTKKEFRQFLLISRGSLQEVNTLLLIAKNLSYLSESKYQAFRTDILYLLRRISALIIKLT